MQIFAAEVMPVLRRECGGGPTLPESTWTGGGARAGGRRRIIAETRTKVSFVEVVEIDLHRGRRPGP